MVTDTLIRKFVELAPKEWGAMLDDDGVELHSVQMQSTLPEDPDWIIGFGLEDDRHSAEAIIFLWDYLEGEGALPMVRRLEHSGRVMVCDALSRNGVPLFDAAYAPTRIEALVHACVALWEHLGKP